MENFNIHNLISFSLINKNKNDFLFKDFNPEYQYFLSHKKCQNHFVVIVDKKTDCEKNISLDNKKWTIITKDYIKQSAFVIKPQKLGLNKYFPFLTLKNIYVRSILMHKILDSNAALVHSAAFQINDKGVILAGRPGVFKTSILMDVIRKFDASFLGEENCIIHRKKIYPFPLNINSLSYKLKFFENEKERDKLQKIKLGLYLLKRKLRYNNLNISKPTEINYIFYVQKGDNFRIKPMDIEEILPYLVENEVLELSIPPTHSLSGIRYNFFKETLQEFDKYFIDNFRNKLRDIFYNNINGKRYFLITTPENYDFSITHKIIELINK